MKAEMTIGILPGYGNVPVQLQPSFEEAAMTVARDPSRGPVPDPVPGPDLDPDPGRGQELGMTMQTVTVDWRAFPSADEVRAHWRRTTGDKPWAGYGRWLCEATGEIHALNEYDDHVSVENWEGDWDRIDDPSMAKEKASRWLPVGKTGLPETWP